MKSAIGAFAFAVASTEAVKQYGAPQGYGGAPAGYGAAPAGYGAAPAGYGAAPTGYGAGGYPK